MRLVNHIIGGINTKIDYNFDKTIPSVHVEAETPSDVARIKEIFAGLGVALTAQRGIIDHAKLVVPAQCSACGVDKPTGDVYVESVVDQNWTVSEINGEDEYTPEPDGEIEIVEKPKRKRGKHAKTT